MLEILLLAVCIWLFAKVAKLAFKMAWGTTKICVSLLLGIVGPLAVWGLAVAGGAVLVVAACLLGLAFGVLRRIV